LICFPSFKIRDKNSMASLSTWYSGEYSVPPANICLICLSTDLRSCRVSLWYLLNFFLKAERMMCRLADVAVLFASISSCSFFSFLYVLKTFRSCIVYKGDGDIVLHDIVLHFVGH
jgi:hypothetical protein